VTGFPMSDFMARVVLVVSVSLRLAEIIPRLQTSLLSFPDLELLKHVMYVPNAESSEGNNGGC
jgi:hypothetical protein